MNRYLAPRPAQWDHGQHLQIARARFGRVLDVNEVDNGDGTASLAVYLEQPANGGLVAGWRADVAAAIYTADPSVANQQSVADAIAQAMAGLQAILDTADLPAGTLTTAQLSNAARQTQTAVKALARNQRRIIRQITGDWTGAD